MGYLNKISSNSYEVTSYKGEKLQYIDPSRIKPSSSEEGGSSSDPASISGDGYYVYQGDQKNWHRVNRCLGIWGEDSDPSTEKPELQMPKAAFINNKKSVKLVVPLDPLDNASGQDNKYYNPAVLPLPVADFEKKTSGVVTQSYSDKIQTFFDKVNNLYDGARSHLDPDKFLQFVESLTDRTELPIPSHPRVGDWVIVQSDQTVADLSDAQYPSTIYVFTYGKVATIEQVSQIPSNDGVCLSVYESSSAPPTDLSQVVETMQCSSYNGHPDADYFIWRVIHTDGSPNEDTIYKVKTTVTTAAYPTDANGNISTPIILTGQIQLAQEDIVGGFYDVSDEATDQGYVHLDSDGRLRLIDYDLLRSGVLAYQLGEDYETPAGVTLEELQNYLDNYVNDRVAFPNANQRMNKTNHPEVIDITINLPSSIDQTEGDVLLIRNVDSRFGSSINLNFVGNPTSNIYIQIDNCQKVRIADTMSSDSTVKVSVSNSCLYYDANILNTLYYDDSSTFGNRLWYERFNTPQNTSGATDPNLIVDGLKVIDASGQITSSRIVGSAINTSSQDDAHFNLALSSITFDDCFNIVGVGMCINISSTFAGGLQELHCGRFEVPESEDLKIPSSRVTNYIELVTYFKSMVSSATGDGQEVVIADNGITLEIEKAEDKTYTEQGAETVTVYSVVKGSYAWEISTSVIPIQLNDVSDVQDISSWISRFYGQNSWVPVDGRATKYKINE